MCPRCGGPVHAPSVWSSAWWCDLHGVIDPLRPASQPTQVALSGLVKSSKVPVWVPWPLPHGWLVTGFSGAGDERTGSRGVAVALSGPNPVGGPADLLVIAEEPGVGLGAGLAGLKGPDPGAGFASGAAQATVRVGSHEVCLWLVAAGDCPGPDGCAAFAGEVNGGWVWIVFWPESAGLMLVESLALRDLRDAEQQWVLPFGALSTHLPA
jgi:hypothetical protein